MPARQGGLRVTRRQLLQGGDGLLCSTTTRVIGLLPGPLCLLQSRLQAAKLNKSQSDTENVALSKSRPVRRLSRCVNSNPTWGITLTPSMCEPQ